MQVLRKHFTIALVLTIWAAAAAGAATKPHVIAFGSWTAVQSHTRAGQSERVKIRTLVVDGHIREYVFGPPHDVTDPLFVPRRAFRLNDSLPEESGGPRWEWQRGGWLMVDRTTGRISAINLPEFEPSYSDASWYRDFVAYCGISEDGKKVDAIVAQIG